MRFFLIVGLTATLGWPQVPTGTLIGTGGGTGPLIMAEFIKAAGGPDALIVLIPTSSGFGGDTAGLLVGQRRLDHRRQSGFIHNGRDVSSDQSRRGFFCSKVDQLGMLRRVRLECRQLVPGSYVRRGAVIEFTEEGLSTPLKSAGAKNVQLIHTRDRNVANPTASSPRTNPFMLGVP